MLLATDITAHPRHGGVCTGVCAWIQAMSAGLMKIQGIYSLNINDLSINDRATLLPFEMSWPWGDHMLKSFPS